MKDIIWSSVHSFKGTRQELIEKLTDYGYDADMLNLASDDVLTETINDTLNNQRILSESTDESVLNDMIAQISDQTYNDIVIIDGQPKYSFDVFDSLSNTEIKTDSDGTIYYGNSPVYVVTKDVIEKIIEESGLTDVNPDDVMIYGDYSEHELPTAKYFYDSVEESLTEAMTEHPIKLQVEVNAIEDLVNEYGLEYITKEGMVFTDHDGGPNVIESEYPEFARVVKSYFKSMGFFDNETGKDPEVINNYWRDLDINQFNIIISACHKLINTKANTEVDFEEKPTEELPMPVEEVFSKKNSSKALNERLPKDAIKYFNNDAVSLYYNDIENSDGKEISKEEALELIRNQEINKIWIVQNDTIVKLRTQLRLKDILYDAFELFKVEGDFANKTRININTARQLLDNHEADKVWVAYDSQGTDIRPIYEVAAEPVLDRASKIFELNIVNPMTPEVMARRDRRRDLHNTIERNASLSKYQKFLKPDGKHEMVDLKIIELAQSGTDEELGDYLINNRKQALQGLISRKQEEVKYLDAECTKLDPSSKAYKNYASRAIVAESKIEKFTAELNELDNISHEEMIEIAKGVRKEINDIYQIDSLTRLKRITRNNLKAKAPAEENLNEDAASGPWSNPKWTSEEDFLTGESEEGVKKVDEELKNSLVEDAVSGPWSKPKWISEADFLTGEE